MAKKETGKDPADFESSLRKELEKRGYSISGTSDGKFQLSHAKKNIKIDVNLAAFSEKFSQGKTILQIADIIEGPEDEQKGLDTSRLYPLLKDATFVGNATQQLTIAAAKAGKALDPLDTLVIFRMLPEQAIYVIASVDTGETFRYLTRRDLGSLDQEKMLAQATENLMKKVNGHIANGKVEFFKQSDSIYSLFVPDDFACSFLLVGQRYIDLIAKSTGWDKKNGFICIPVTNDEMLICDPGETLPNMDTMMDAVRSRQDETESKTSKKAVRTMPILLTETGWKFLKKG